MKLNYLANRLAFRLKHDGLKDAFNDIIFRNKNIIVIEKDILENPIKKKQNIEYVIADKSNFENYQTQYKIKNLKYYCDREGECLIGLKDENYVGFQWLTKNKYFVDLKKLNIDLKDDEAYLFDLYVLPQYRGTYLPLALSWETYNYLMRNGIKKIYGFYFQDNIKALWWHRSVLRAKEIKKLKANRFFVFEQIDGKFFMNI